MIKTYMRELSDVLYECKMWSLALKKGHKLQVPEMKCSGKYVDIGQICEQFMISCN